MTWKGTLANALSAAHDRSIARQQQAESARDELLAGDKGATLAETMANAHDHVHRRGSAPPAGGPRIVRVAHDPGAFDEFADLPLTYDYRDRHHRKESQHSTSGEGVNYIAKSIPGSYPPRGAHGRYQMTNIALQDIKLVDRNGVWLADNALGIPNYEAFMYGPDAPRHQEDAMVAYTRNNERYLRGNERLREKIGSTIRVRQNGVERDVSVGLGNMLAVMHKEGIGGLKKLLDFAEQNIVDLDQIDRTSDLGFAADRLKFFEGVEPWVAPR